MKQLFTLFLLIGIYSCDFEKDKISNPRDSYFQVPGRSIAERDSFGDLINKISELKQLPYTWVNSSWEVDSNFIFCGDSLYWQIIKVGKPIAPYLIHKMLDSSKSNIKLQCTDVYLNNGAIAFILFDKIISVPYAWVFESQWCTATQNCNFGYPDFLLDMVNNNPGKTHKAILEWYNKFEKQFMLVEIWNKIKCHQQYGVNTKWQLDYSIDTSINYGKWSFYQEGNIYTEVWVNSSHVVVADENSLHPRIFEYYHDVNAINLSVIDNYSTIELQDQLKYNSLVENVTEPREDNSYLEKHLSLLKNSMGKSQRIDPRTPEIDTSTKFIQAFWKEFNKRKENANSKH